MEAYRTSPHPDKRGGFFAPTRDKPPRKIHHAHVIRNEFEPLADRPPDLQERLSAPLATRARTKPSPPKPLERQALPTPAPIPAWARASGRAGEGGLLFAAGAGLALLDACLRAELPATGALRARLALQSAAASAKILRVNADEAALRDLRFVIGDPSGPAANLLSLWRDGAEPAPQPRSRPDCRRSSAARPGCGLERPRSEPEGLRRRGRSGLRGRKRRRPGVLAPSRTPQQPKPKSWRSGRSTSPLPSGCAGRGPCR